MNLILCICRCLNCEDLASGRELIKKYTALPSLSRSVTRPFSSQDGVSTRLVMALILAVNAGSSSLKITLFRRLFDDKIAQELLVASISSIQSNPTTFKLSISGNSTINEGVNSISNHSSAFAYFLDAVRKHADINLDQIHFICHRVVHGGDFREPVKVDQRSYSYIEHFSNLAPLYVLIL